ncbi:unnamed protein product [Protopolystoma xenopodis]|uniref:Uncharacterized protein n=1 Tax=Protopolystoma xenopodis TaxID=117903 RepID=A0A448WQQ5_9PLAT|nr:unnamed protein product [Protopolystoma xenopodis]
MGNAQPWSSAQTSSFQAARQSRHSACLRPVSQLTFCPEAMAAPLRSPTTAGLHSGKPFHSRLLTLVKVDD